MVYSNQTEPRASACAIGSAPSTVANSVLLECLMEIGSKTDAPVACESAFAPRERGGAARPRSGYAT